MDAAQEIKARLDIVDVVQEYLPLKPAGSGSFKGLCPFHHEKSPSFFANRPRQSWHCFGCDQGGDAISFVMQMEGFEFREALEHLAQKTGVQLPAFDPARATEKKRLSEINDLAARWFRSILVHDPRADAARAYLAKRGVDDLTADLWRLGFAPDEWEALTTALKAKDVTEDELLRAGLASKREGGRGAYDRFRGRIMFPICDAHGNVVGFTGRILEGNASKNPERTEAKYVNTPETPIYKKSAILYGLDKAKGEIKRRDLAVIVEGNMDVVSSHQFGVAHVVASSGTALTAEQLGLLKRYTMKLAIAFDQDAAGKAATIRGLDLARSLDFDIRIISLPPEAGKDPDDAVRKDVRLWTDAIENALGIIEWLYRQAFRSGDAHTPEGKKQIAREILPEIKRIADPIERDAWLSRLGQDLNVSADALRDAIRSMPVAGPAKAVEKSAASEKPQATASTKSRETQLLERILAILELKPDLRPLAESGLKGYSLPITIPDDLSQYLAILADREFEDQSLAELQRELERTVAILRNEFRVRERQRLEQEMRDAELAGDTARIQTLLAQFDDLNT